MTRTRRRKHWRNYYRMLWINRAVFAWAVGMALLNAMQHEFVLAFVALGSVCAEGACLADLMPRWRATLLSGERIERELAREAANLDAVAAEWLVPYR